MTGAHDRAPLRNEAIFHILETVKSAVTFAGTGSIKNGERVLLHRYIAIGSPSKTS